MSRTAAACLAAAALFAAACGTERQQAETETTPAVEVLPPAVAHAVAVARGLEANPAAADSILAAHGLTAAGLDSLMYVIAADSALSAAYADALK